MVADKIFVDSTHSPGEHEIGEILAVLGRALDHIPARVYEMNAFVVHSFVFINRK